MTDDDLPDDLDALFAAVPTAPPPGLAQGTRDRLAALRRAWRLTALLLLELVAFLSLALLAYELGTASQSSGALALFRAAVEDYRLTFEEPVALTSAVIAALPWLHVLALSLNALLLMGLTSFMLRRAGTLRRPALDEGRR